MMKKDFLYSTLFGSVLILYPVLLSAQNYIPPTSHGGPNVIVNMDVLAPAYQTQNAPIRLTRPQNKATPLVQESRLPPAVLRPPVANKQNVLALKKPMPLEPKIVLKKPTLKTKPIPPNQIVELLPPKPKGFASAPTFSDDLIAKPVIKETKIIDTVADKSKDAVENRQRQLLAAAREEIKYDIATQKTEQKTTDIKSLVRDIAPIKPLQISEPLSTSPVTVKKEDTVAVVDLPKISAPSKLELPPVSDLITPPDLPPIAPAPINNAVKDLQIQDDIEIAALTPPQILPNIVEENKIDPTPIVKTPKTDQKVSAIIDNRDAFRLIFSGASADLSSDDEQALNQVATKLNENKNGKIQLRAYADGTPETSSKARRLSLTRALKVRSYLLDKGVKATAMDVRALGLGTNGDARNVNISADRVDIVFVR